LTTPVDGRPPLLATIGERGLIQRIRDRFPAPAGALQIGIGDDAAVAAGVRGEFDVLTTDALVEGVHFDLRFSSFADVGYKALAVNVSDIAAMGATPRLALLSLILPDRLTIADVDSLLDGLLRMADEAGVVLAGGNITRTPGPLTIDVTAIGHVRHRRGPDPRGREDRGPALCDRRRRRGGCRPGDAQGRGPGPGGCGRGGADRAASPPGAAAARSARCLAGRGSATACMDLSDGLADAVSQLAQASGTGAVIDADALPDPGCRPPLVRVPGARPGASRPHRGRRLRAAVLVSPRAGGRLRTVIRQARGRPRHAVSAS
jgi:thiamine-monophosphate kinase